MATSRPSAAERYAEDILAGRIPSGELMKAAVLRQKSDLEKSRSKSYPYRFDAAKAQAYIDFIELLPHIKGKWARDRECLKLQGWEQFICWCTFGWVSKSTGMRRFSKCYVEVARKNGKTTLAAAMAIACFFLDGDVGMEIYCVATKKDQAKLAWATMEQQITKSPSLSKRVRVFNLQNSACSISRLADSSYIRCLGQDSDTEDGLNPSVAIVDEYHAHRTNAMLEVIQSGTGARDQPLTIIITTAGVYLQGPCYAEERDLGVRVLTDRAKSEAAFFAIYELDDGDDWTDMSVAVKANPGLGVSVSEDYLRERIDEALRSPRKQALIRTKNFNQWVSAASAWIDSQAWDAIGADFDFEELENRRCYIGIDLSRTIDLTAVCFAFPNAGESDKLRVLVRYYMPEGLIEEKSKQDSVPYSTWRDQGWIMCTPGPTVDMRWVRQDILSLVQDYSLDVVQVAYDPWSASELVKWLADDGLDMVEFRQGYATISPCAKAFEKAVLDQTLEHNRNPILAWNVDCVELESDPAGNIKPSKKSIAKSSKRIDGVIAAIMALGLFIIHGDEQMVDDGTLYSV